MTLTVTPETVRKALDIALDAATLPDEVINLDLYAGRAIAEIQDRVEDADDYTGDDETHLNNAANYFTASLLAPKISSLGFYATTGQFDRLQVNWAKRAEMLWADGEKEIAEVVDADTEEVAVNSRSGAAQVIARW